MTIRRRWLAACVALLLAAFAVLGAGVASAQADSPPTLIRAIDATDPDNVQLQLVYGGDDIDNAKVTSDGAKLEAGDPVRYVESDNDPIGLVIVVDTSSAMDDSGALTASRDGLLELINQKHPDQAVAIIAAGDVPTLITGFSTNPDRLKSAVDSLGPSPEGGGAVWGAIDQGAQLLSERDELQPNIMVITAGTETPTAGVTPSGATGQAISAGATAFVLGAENAGFEAGPLEELVDDVGGSLNTYGSGGDLTEGIAVTGGWLRGDQFIIPFVANRTSGVVPVTVTIGDTEVEGAYVTGRLSEGAQEVKPIQASSGGFTVDFLTGSTGKYLGVILALFAVAAFCYALFLLVGKDDGALSNVLQPYSEGYKGDFGDDEDEGDSSLAKSALIQRVVAMTEQVAESQGYLSRTEAALERASLPLRAGEALFFYVAGVVLITIFAFLFFGNLLGGLVIGLIAALVPPSTVSFLAGKRRREFLQQLPDTLQLLAGTLRAGYSLMQGVEAVSQEVAEPMGKELRRVVTEARLGRPLEESLDGIAERMSSPDFAWAVMAIRIQREVGGNLSELLMTVAETMTARERLRRDISALTAEGRVSAMVLGLLPVGLGFAMFVINPDYIGKLFNTGLGNVLLGLAVVGMLVGFAWMRQIIKIEI